MNFIEARRLVHEYIRRDEEGNVESIQTALDHVDLDIEPGKFVAVLAQRFGKIDLCQAFECVADSDRGNAVGGR